MNCSSVLTILFESHVIKHRFEWFNFFGNKLRKGALDSLNLMLYFLLMLDPILFKFEIAIVLLYCYWISFHLFSDEELLYELHVFRGLILSSSSCVPSKHDILWLSSRHEFVQTNQNCLHMIENWSFLIGLSPTLKTLHQYHLAFMISKAIFWS